MTSIGFRKWLSPDAGIDQRVRLIVKLCRRRDRILESSELDLGALSILSTDYEAACLASAAADLRRRLEHYRDVL